MRKKEEFFKSIKTIYKLFEFEIKDILIFYERNKKIKEQEGILDKEIFEKWKYKEINWYIFIDTYWWIPIEPVITNKQIIILKDEFYKIKRINYSNITWLLCIFEKYIPKLISEMIFYDENIMRNKDYKIKLWSTDIYFLTQKAIEVPTENILIRMLSFEMTQNILHWKKEILKKLWKLLNIKFAKNEDIFKNFIEIRNIICHSDGVIDFETWMNITNWKVSGQTLYLRSEEVIKMVNYILEITKELNKKILEKYK